MITHINLQWLRKMKVNNRIEDIVKDIEKLRDKHAPDNNPDREKYDELIDKLEGLYRMMIAQGFIN